MLLYYKYLYCLLKSTSHSKEWLFLLKNLSFYDIIFTIKFGKPNKMIFDILRYGDSMTTFNNILNSNITFNEYADKWLNNYRLHINKFYLPIVINNIKIGKYYFGQKRLKDITLSDYQQFITNYSSGRNKFLVEQANLIIQTVLKSTLNNNKSKSLLKI